MAPCLARQPHADAESETEAEVEVEDDLEISAELVTRGQSRHYRHPVLVPMANLCRESTHGPHIRCIWSFGDHL
jgi:hypothetical protein